MSAVIRNLCFDAHDAYAQTMWWNDVLEDFAVEDGDGMAPGDEECGLVGPDGRWLLFLTVPEGKTVKNRVHPCLVPTDRTRDAEVDRIVGLGAGIVADRRNDDGSGWVVLADPEGNEFCVLRSDAERAGGADPDAAAEAGAEGDLVTLP